MEQKLIIFQKKEKMLVFTTNITDNQNFYQHRGDPRDPNSDGFSMNQYGINYGYHMNQAPFRPGATEQRMNESNIQMPGDWCTITYYECDVQV